jgi:hypothetical protein
MRNTGVTVTLLAGGKDRHHINFGLKVFMDAHQPVTLKEGDRYPLGPPSFVKVLASEVTLFSILRRY